MKALDIYKLLPKTNCKKCGYQTCLSLGIGITMDFKNTDKLQYCEDISSKNLISIFELNQPPMVTHILHKDVVDGERAWWWETI